jgi:hypothetical protein
MGAVRAVVSHGISTRWATVKIRSGVRRSERPLLARSLDKIAWSQKPQSWKASLAPIRFWIDPGSEDALGFACTKKRNKIQ